MNTTRLVADLKRITRDAEDLIEATAGDVTDQAKEIRARLRKALAAAKESCGELQGTVRDGVTATDTVIRDHPYQSIGVAFGVGLLIGVLALRQRGE